MNPFLTTFNRTTPERITRQDNSEYLSSGNHVFSTTAQPQLQTINSTAYPLVLPWVVDPQFDELTQAGWLTTTSKRVMDITGALLVTIFVLSWLVPILGVLILWESEGPIFFMQPRSGRRGRPFYCMKFRTMYNRPQSTFEQTRQQDSRITRVGAFLRKTNLDEMPQFINVLMGDMSLVGPRPHALQHDAQHWDSSAYRKRYWVKPGITGLAQARGNRGETQRGFMMEHRIRYDHFYIKRQSVSLDVKICLATLGVMLKGDKNAW
ncbi:sugar transferase [Spirosoma sp. KNUC1025]|uniref:sugar transferase n=1 Tax=Spirosoma sp. KNUC1025 TaxID=2894082 RepID=UPI003865B37C|nr:sugar transferase [Spirosoma sp. KNUC1025]